MSDETLIDAPLDTQLVDAVPTSTTADADIDKVPEVSEDLCSALRVVLLNQIETLSGKLTAQLKALNDGDITAEYWNAQFTEYNTTLHIAAAKSARDQILVYADHRLLVKFPKKKRTMLKPAAAPAKPTLKRSKPATTSTKRTSKKKAKKTVEVDFENPVEKEEEEEEEVRHEESDNEEE